mmetsp:Transcript_8284/g.14282  ORF Transcript_8284/g.14282 Transcript_8284/m.14282 type:complete len:305 (+) Transcript_8284:66-980(+)
MPSSVLAGVNVVEVPGTTITEFFGNASTKDASLSAAHVKITAPVTNPWQTPEFAEHIMMIAGEAHVEHSGGTAILKAGEGLILPAGCRVRWIFPGPAEYVPICLPAFSPENVHRAEGDAAPVQDAPLGDMRIKATNTIAPVSQSNGHAYKILGVWYHQDEVEVPAPVVLPPVDVVKAPALTITEFFGNVASKECHISACVAKVDEPCSEAWQKPEFAEWVLVLSGTLHLEHATGITKVPAGSGVFLAANERVKWIWPEACVYVPICMPAFTPDGCHREAEEGSAKDVDPSTMERLTQLHTAVGA